METAEVTWFRTKQRVWGIGLTRTGSTSLNRALQRLGYASVHWPTTHDLLYEDLEAATDESVAPLYRYLDFKYPGSKFVLTDRDEDDWLWSTARHRERHRTGINRLLSIPACKLHHIHRDRRAEVVFTQMTLYGSIEFDAPKFAAGRRRHLCCVTDYFKHRPLDLLRLNICAGDGWPKLCDFLGCSVPTEPFPHANAATVALASPSED